MLSYRLSYYRNSKMMKDKTKMMMSYKNHVEQRLRHISNLLDLRVLSLKT